MDPSMPEEVEGDLPKFRQIVTSILNFALKCSNKINMQTNANFSIDNTAFIIYFSITFKPKIELKIDNLRALFSNDDLSLSSQTKMNNHVGLSIHLVSCLVNIMGGKFTEIEQKQNGEIFIMFTLPFDIIESSKRPYINKTDIRLSSSRSYENGSMVLKSPEINSKVVVRTNYNQEANDEINDMHSWQKMNSNEEQKVLPNFIKGDEIKVKKVRNSIK